MPGCASFAVTDVIALAVPHSAVPSATAMPDAVSAGQQRALDAGEPP
jgi:hypothetical protein